MSETAYRYVYGPVPSRRFGRSLGVDLVPFKICSYDCIYCQLGRTTRKTLEREVYVAVDAVVQEVTRRLKAVARPDYITMAGSGEPTLNAEIGLVIRKLKSLTNIPVVVLTNGSLLGSSAVREDLLAADVVVPSLDAGDAFLFERVNRPCQGLTFEQITEGLATFSQQFKGSLILEVMLLAGITGFDSEVKKIARYAAACGIKQVQLNTVIRPPVEDFAAAIPAGQMRLFQKIFSGKVELISGDGPVVDDLTNGGSVSDRDLLSLLCRRPCTVAGIASGLSLIPNDVLKRLGPLIKDGRVRAIRKNNSLYYESLRK